MRFSNTLRLTRRAAVVCLATAGITALGGPAVQAAPSDETASERTASAAAVVRTYGYACAGAQVRRCAWFNLDHTNNRIRAYSYIVDVNGGRNYTVATNRVRLQAWNGRAWVNTGYNADADGWHATSDGALGKLVGCRNGGVYTLRSVAYFAWRGNPNGAQWGATRAIRVAC
jgi:hypothetical protein